MLRINIILGVFLLFLTSISAISDDMKAIILKKHNDYRRLIANGKGGQPPASNMREMTWDNELEKKAQEHANKCTINHNTYADRRTSKFEMVGQNICLSKDIPGCVDLWFLEKNNYQFSGQQCKKDNCGHYTQMVWASTHKIGCGIGSCSFGNSVVCNYGPAGNEEGADPYTEGYSAAECPPGTKKNDGLCC